MNTTLRLVSASAVAGESVETSAIQRARARVEQWNTVRGAQEREWVRLLRLLPEAKREAYLSFVRRDAGESELPNVAQQG